MLSVTVLTHVLYLFVYRSAGNRQNYSRHSTLAGLSMVKTSFSGSFMIARKVIHFFCLLFSVLHVSILCFVSLIRIVCVCVAVKGFKGSNFTS